MAFDRVGCQGFYMDTSCCMGWSGVECYSMFSLGLRLNKRGIAQLIKSKQELDKGR